MTGVEEKHNHERRVPDFSGRCVLVVGDFVADRYLLTEPSRLSREAPVLVARYQDEELIPGGAANTAQNLLALGAKVLPVGIVGRDEAGDALVAHFEECGVDVSGILRCDDRVTITKTRVMVGDPNRMKQQVLRIDRDPDGSPDDRMVSSVLASMRDRLSGADAVLLSDYGYGTVAAPVLDGVRGAAGDRIVTADSRYLITSFRGVDLATPNENEVEDALGFRLRTVDDLDRAGEILRTRMDVRSLLITRGKNGMALFRTGHPRLDIPATGSAEVTDVSGAGDTVIAVATLSLAAGADVAEAARLSNAAASVVVMKPGAATCSVTELERALGGLG